MKTRSEILTSAFDGARIPVVITAPPKPDRWLLMIHGLGTSKHEYLQFYDFIATKMAESNVASIRYDCRGHGNSEASPREFTIINNIKDALWCLNEVQRWSPGARVDLLGTSFGAPTAICCSILEPRRIGHIYLIAPVLDFNSLYLSPISERREKYSNFKMRTLDELGSIDVDGRLAFRAENCIEFAIIDIPSMVTRIQQKLTVIHGDADSMVPISVTEKVLKQAPAAQFHTFHNMDHGFTDAKDEHGTSEQSQDNLRRIAAILGGRNR